MYFYKAHGLRICSDIEIPDFEEWQNHGASQQDLVIQQAPLDARWDWQGFDKSWWLNCASDKRIRIDVADCARFLILPEGKILYAPDHDQVRPLRMRSYLLGRVLGAALCQKGFFPLHGSAVMYPEGVAIVMGHSGRGKSTLVFDAVQRGDVLISDDVSVISFPSDRPQLSPGIRRNKLWAETLSWFGLSQEGLDPVEEQENKFHHYPQNKPIAERLAPDAIFVLGEFGDHIGHTKLARLDALQAISDNLYTIELMPLLGQGPDFLDFAVRLTNSVPIYRLDRPKGLGHLEKTRAHIRKILAG